MEERFGRKGTFATTRHGERQQSRFIVIALVVSSVAFAILWFLFFSHFFNVTNLDIQGVTMLSREEVTSSTFEILKSKNMFRIEPVELAESLRERLFAEKVTVDKVYPNVLRLKIEERQRSVLLASKDQLLLVDTNGVVVSEAADQIATVGRQQLSGSALADLSRVPVIVCELTEFVTTGYQVAQTETIRAWLDAYKRLLEQRLSFRYVSMSSPISRTMNIRMEKGFDLIIDLQTPLEPQIETYTKYMATKPKDVEIHEYIDIRVPGKLFIK